jgi:hypothetical protein
MEWLDRSGLGEVAVIRLFCLTVPLKVYGIIKF